MLAVDNDPDALDALRQVLVGWGCSVAIAADGASADAALRERDADLWLFDYHLDAGDTGVALAGRLRAVHGQRPCLILSADQTDAVRRAVRDADLPLLAKLQAAGAEVGAGPFAGGAAMMAHCRSSERWDPF